MNHSNRVELPPSVNYHLWQPCNMRCRFCFAAFEDVKETVLPKGHLPKEESLRLTILLAQRFKKVTFAGGEPTLCPWLHELVVACSLQGSVSMLVTNGSKIDEPWLDRFAGSLHWLTLSIDSAREEVHREVGRSVGGRAIPTERYIQMAESARKRGMRIKVNTVVTRQNAAEDMTDLITRLGPERWKVLQALPIEGQNDQHFAAVKCADADFRKFVLRHQGRLPASVELVPEDNHAMRGSYAMVDPAGRFFDNVSGRLEYSKPILSAGLHEAWQQIRFSKERFQERGGDYDFGSTHRRSLPLRRDV